MKALLDDQKKFFLAARAAVLEKGRDYVYGEDFRKEEDLTCLYVRDGKPSCLVGHGLINSGLIKTEDFVEYEGRAAYAIVPWRDAVADVIDAMQGNQDSADPWGTAYDKAIKALKYHGYDVTGLGLED